jgi:hypothetical protein
LSPAWTRFRQAQGPIVHALETQAGIQDAAVVEFSLERAEERGTGRIVAL